MYFLINQTKAALRLLSETLINLIKPKLLNAQQIKLLVRIIHIHVVSSIKLFSSPGVNVDLLSQETKSCKQCH